MPGYAPSLGLYGSFGIEFYIQAGSRLTFNFQTASDLIPLRRSDSRRASPLFLENGFAIGFASSLADTRTRAKKLREARKKRTGKGK